MPTTANSSTPSAGTKKLVLINHGKEGSKLASSEISSSPTSDLTTSISPNSSSTSLDLEQSIAILVGRHDDDTQQEANGGAQRRFKSPSPTRLSAPNKKQKSDVTSAKQVANNNQKLTKNPDIPPNIIAQTYSKNISTNHITLSTSVNQNHKEPLLSTSNKNSKKIPHGDKITTTTTTTIITTSNSSNRSSPTTSFKANVKEPINNNNDKANSNSNLTKPLVINQTSSISEDNPIAKQQQEIAVIPGLSSQLIFSSIMTTQQSNNKNTTTTKTTTVSHNGNNHHGMKSSLSSVDLHNSNKNQRTLPSNNSNLSLSTPSIYSAIIPTTTTITTNTPNQSPISTAGNAVTARLMDMGKKLLDASKEGRTEDVRQLVVNAGAPFTSDWLGTTALHLAAQNGHAEVAEILLNGGVNRDAKTKLERTALHHAAQSGSLDVVDLLLIHGSDVNARDMLKMTPLHWAVERGHYFVAERLLLSGADVTSKSKFQLTPLEIAQKSECFEMIELFKNWAKSGSIDNHSYDDTNSSCYIDSNLFLNTGSNNNKVNSANSNTTMPTINSNYDNNVDNNNVINYNAIQFNESYDIIDEIDYRLSFENHHHLEGTSTRTSLNLDVDEPCIDLVELELNTLKFEPDFFLSNDEEEDETKVEYLMKVVEELQKENKQLRQRVEQLQTTTTR